jgi:AcrR family transcriptional regulator
MPNARPTARGGRREAIVSAAAKLFAAQGYPATGIDEIGAGAGITGPGVYRHFENKNDVLAEVVGRAVDGAVTGMTGVVDSGVEGWAVVEGLVDNMLGRVLDDRDAWAVVVREQRHLDRASQRSLGRAHRSHLEAWVQALAAVRPDLSDEQVRVVVAGVLGVVTPFALRPGAPPGRDRTAALLREAALAIMRHSVPR